MASLREYKYDPVSEDGRSSGDETLGYLNEKKEKPWYRKIRLAFLLLGLEVLHLSTFTTIFYLSQKPHERGYPGPDINGLADLATYNTTVTYTNDNTIVESSRFADEFWSNFMPLSAVVGVDVKLVEKFGMPESVVSPTQPHQMLYQIDGFHELHCLYRLRRILVGAATSQDHAHTLHCLNYIRQTLMCNLDLTLGSTENLMNYGLKDKRVCRDYDAITAWVERNKWKEWGSWQKAKLDAHHAKLKQYNGTLLPEASHKSPYRRSTADEN